MIERSCVCYIGNKSYLIKLGQKLDFREFFVYKLDKNSMFLYNTDELLGGHITRWK